MINNSSYFPNSIIHKEIENFLKNKPIDAKSKYDSTFFKFSFNVNYVQNNGHPNIDNSGEIFALGSHFSLISSRFSFYNKWVILEIEPYLSSQNNIYTPQEIEGSNTYKYLNNHNSIYKNSFSRSGLRQSLIALHFRGFGIGYGKMNHWWSPGFHNAISLSSNAPSQETYILGTFKEMKLNKLFFESQIVLKPYLNYKDQQIYFSGLRTKFTIKSNPSISIGFHRTFLSGAFNDMSIENYNQRNWSNIDAIQLIFSPIFGQSKKGINYTLPGTPGFDIWDELLSGFIIVSFPKDNFEIYVDLASDDSRGNFSDLRAHWDHTMGYTIGFKKYFINGKRNYLIAAEHLSTTISNTFNDSFYRGDSKSPNFYLRETYNYFTYDNRRMGAHSGSSSEDLYLLLGLFENNFTYLFSYSKEFHGLKSMKFPEIKSEINFSLKYFFNKNQSISINVENESIKNYAFKNKHASNSRFIWLGFSYGFK